MFSLEDQCVASLVLSKVALMSDKFDEQNSVQDKHLCRIKHSCLEFLLLLNLIFFGEGWEGSRKGLQEQ